MKWIVTIQQQPPGEQPREMVLEIDAESVYLDGDGTLVFYGGVMSHGSPTGLVACFRSGSWLRLVNPEKVTPNKGDARARGAGGVLMTSLELCDELYAESKPADRCPYLGVSRQPSPSWRHICLSPKLPDDTEARAMPCDHFSLQLWCLAGPERWPVCECYVTPPRKGELE